jgi:hypothetical protein
MTLSGREEAFLIECSTFGGTTTPAPGPSGSTWFAIVMSNTPSMAMSACSRVW